MHIKNKSSQPVFAKILMCSFLVFLGCSSNQEAQQQDYSIEEVAHDKVTLTDDFWSERLAVNKEVTIPHIISKLVETQRMRNFELASAGSGTFCTVYPFDDSDAYKLLEAVSYELARNPDPELNQRADELIAKIGDAQQEDGYIYPYAVLNENEDGSRNKEWWYGNERWEKVHLHSHELYNAGHLIEAAVAHHNATGKRNLLNIAIKFADLITETFGPEEDMLQSIPGHQEIELALVKLYRLTGEQKYLDTANFFLEERGKAKYNEEGELSYGEYKQNHLPVTKQTEAEGHSVRAAYMYSAMADVGVLTGNQAYLVAIDKVWENIVSKKLYIIGGIGATGDSEGFGPNYDLPNRTSYNETCASIANVLWNYRMFKIHGDAKYIDVLERSLYNNVIAGHSMQGDLFFYPNRLESDGGIQRSEWFSCACCPPNLARTFASMPRYIYSSSGNTAFVNLFAANETELELDGTLVQISQQTDYPWEGTVNFAINPQTESEFTLKIRIPGWARNQPVPGNLYTYRDESSATPELFVNGEKQSLQMDKGYAVITRNWLANDNVELRLPMQVRQVVAHDSVEADAGKVVLERGPFVYAIESVDNTDDVLDYKLDISQEFSTEYQPDKLNGITTINGTAYVEGQSREMTAIPYYSWAHRGDSKMAVWMDEYQMEN